ncbi:hypothetical protein LCGC14_2260980, partial [marine sediment metagenome]
SASVHSFGERAKEAVEEAREKVAIIIGAKSDQIYFTNSATEANNIIIKGRILFADKCATSIISPRIITSNTEHSSVKNCLSKIVDDRMCTGYGSLSWLNIGIDNLGNLDYELLDSMLDRVTKLDTNTILVSILAVNNEIGTIHDLYRIGDICKKHNVLFHTDATQAIGNITIDVDKMNIFALTMSGHKIYGPKGVGALYVRDKSLVEPLTDGGYQNTFISGTQNVPAIVGMGKACELCNEKENIKIEQLRNCLLHKLTKEIPDIIVNGTMVNRLQNNLSVTIPGVSASILVKGMDDVIISGGPACGSGDLQPSHVIEALGTPHPECAIRIGLGRKTTQNEIEFAADRIIEIVQSIRSE